MSVEDQGTSVPQIVLAGLGFNFQLKTVTEIRPLTTPFRAMDWSPYGKNLVTASIDGAIRTWSIESASSQELHTSTSSPPSSIAWSPSGTAIAATTAEGELLLLHPQRTDERPTVSVRTNSQSPSLAWIDASTVVTAGRSERTAVAWRDGLSIAGFDALTGSIGAIHAPLSGRWLGLGLDDGTIDIWDTAHRRRIWRRTAHSGMVNSIASNYSGWLMVTGSDDMTVRLWHSASGQEIAVLEGHTSPIAAVTIAPSGSVVASIGIDGVIRFWEISSLQQISRVAGRVLSPPSVPGQALNDSDPSVMSVSGDGQSDPSQSHLLTGSTIKFHPFGPRGPQKEQGLEMGRVAALDHRSGAILVSDYTYNRSDLVLPTNRRAESNTESTTHSSVKVVLLGESNAGKSSLAYRMANKTYSEQSTTHGIQFWFLRPEDLNSDSRPVPGESREVILWDLGGQDEYRLVHELFLDDVTVALVLFDPTRGRVAFEEVKGWNRRLERRGRVQRSVKLLVGTKLDIDHDTIDLQEINRLIEECGFLGYYSTSAKANRGIEELGRAIDTAIDWKNLARIGRPKLFQRIRSNIQERISRGEIVVFVKDLEKAVSHENPDRVDTASFQAVIRQLALQGVVVETQLSSEERALVLQVGEIERYAGSLIIMARNNPRGVPTLEERTLASPTLSFPGISSRDRLERTQERVVLECVIELLLQNGICLSHDGLLIFPSLFRTLEGKWSGENEYPVNFRFDFSGSVDNAYAALVTSLAISERFGVLRLWEDRAEFEDLSNGLCGILKISGSGGYGRLDIYFSEGVNEESRDLFLGFIDDHLKKFGVDVLERLDITCTCGRTYAEDIVRERLAQGKADIGCSVCDRRIQLFSGLPQDLDKGREMQRKMFALRTHIEDEKKKAIVGVTGALRESRPERRDDEPIRILHLSDLHFDASVEPLTALQPLLTDLRDESDGFSTDRVDYIVVSGDFTNRATPEEFEVARGFVSELMDRLSVTAERLIVVPGNHDVNWDTEVKVYEWKSNRQVKGMNLPEGHARQEGNGMLVRIQDRYPYRFENFSRYLFHPLFHQEYPLEPRLQATPHLYPKEGIQFLTLNSNWEIDEHFRHRSSVNLDALARGLDEAERQVAEAVSAGQMAVGWPLLRIAVWHHPITGAEKIVDDAFVDQLRRANFKLCMHGHVHEERADLVGYLHPRQLHVAGTGSFGAWQTHRPESTPRLYSLFEYDRSTSTLRVHTRARRKVGGSWSGWAVWPSPNRNEQRSFYEVALT